MFTRLTSQHMESGQQDEEDEEESKIREIRD